MKCKGLRPITCKSHDLHRPCAGVAWQNSSSMTSWRSKKRSKKVGYLFILDKCFDNGRPYLAALKTSFSMQETVFRSYKNSFSGHLNLLCMPCVLIKKEKEHFFQENGHAVYDNTVHQSRQCNRLVTKAVH